MTKRTRSRAVAVAIAAAFGCCLGVQGRAVEAGCEWLDNGGETVSKIVSPPAQDIDYSAYGYNFPYVLYVPANPLTQGFRYLIVEPNNPGVPGLRATEQLVRAYVAATETSLGHILADAFKAPLLMPAFPRPWTDERRSDFYAQSLSREAMEVASGPLYRVDLQLIAMADEARDRLVPVRAETRRQVRDRRLLGLGRVREPVRDAASRQARRGCLRRHMRIAHAAG